MVYFITELLIIKMEANAIEEIKWLKSELVCYQRENEELKRSLGAMQDELTKRKISQEQMVARLEEVIQEKNRLKTSRYLCN